MIQIVRYTETPVGPYDELLVIPGNFEVHGGSQKGTSRMRIARMYVSQRETTFNGTYVQPLLIGSLLMLTSGAGRKNWNIPKHLARFEFSAPLATKGKPSPPKLTVSVFPHKSATGDTTKPFFHATLTRMSYLPSFPYSTRWTPLNTTLVQPPIPAGDDGLLCGTDTWKAFEVVASTQKARLMWVKMGEEDEVERGGHWPDVKSWAIGLWLEDATLVVPEPEEWRE